MGKFARLLTTACVLPFLFGSAFAGTVYVRTTGSDSNDGSTEGFAMQTIQAALEIASEGDTIDIGPGTFNESVLVEKTITLHGDGDGSTIVRGPQSGIRSTILIQASNVVVEKMLVTRVVPATALWANVNVKTVGISVAAYSDGTTIRECRIEGNNEGLLVKNARNVVISRNRITNNYRGISLTDHVGGLNVTQNVISNNWTHGIYITSFSTETELPYTPVAINENRINGNWYGAIQINPLTFLTPGYEGAYDLTYNYIAATPTFDANDHPVPLYMDLIPATYGGTAAIEDAGGDSVRIDGLLADLLDVSPSIMSAEDTDPDTPGWQPGYGALRVSNYGAQSLDVGPIQEAIDTAIVGSTIYIDPGTYEESPYVYKYVNLEGVGYDAMSGTIIHGTLAIEANGPAADTALSIRKLRIAGSSDQGLLLSTACSHIVIDSVASVDNTTDGVTFSSGLFTDITFSHCILNDNGRAGIYTGDAIDLDSLNITFSEVKGNNRVGFIYSPDESGDAWLTNVRISDVLFQANGDATNVNGNTDGNEEGGGISSVMPHDNVGATAPGGDILFFDFNGRAVLEDVDIIGALIPAAQNGLLLSGSDTLAPMGAVTLRNVSITGLYQIANGNSNLPDAPGYGMYIASYSDVDSLTIDGVSVDLLIGNALGVAAISDTLVLNGTLSLDAADTSSFYIYADTSPINNVDGLVYASDVVLGGKNPYEYQTLTECFDLSERIIDRVDAYSAIEPNSKRAYVRFFPYDIYTSTKAGPNVQLQNAIDVAEEGSKIHVRAGDYGKQIAPGKHVLGGAEEYQFGLYFGTRLVDFTGYAVGDSCVACDHEIAVTFTTGATNSFGPSGIFVEAEYVRLMGFEIGNNYDDLDEVDNNKTIEVIGNGFDLSFCILNPDFGSVYIAEWDSARYAERTIDSYYLSDNVFTNTVVSVNNGVGVGGGCGCGSAGFIMSNRFDGDPGDDYYSISFRGWNGPAPIDSSIVFPVGGADIAGNVFCQPVQHIVLARGNVGGYVDTTINWKSIAHENRFEGAPVMILATNTPFSPRTYDIDGYTNSRFLTSGIANGIDLYTPGDTIWVADGQHDDSPVIRTNQFVLMAESDDVVLSYGNYFIFDTTGISDTSFYNWSDIAMLDYIAVQRVAPMQEAANFVHPFGTLHLIAGTYDMTSAVTLDSGITISGPFVGDDCNFAPEVTVNTTTGAFNASGPNDVYLENMVMNIDASAGQRFLRLTHAANMHTQNIIFKRNGVRLFGVNTNGVQPDRDVPKFVDDGNDAGYGPGRVIYGDLAPMPTSNIAAAWKGDDANAATVSTVNDYGPNAYTLSQTNVLRKPTRQEIGGNFVVTSAVTRYVAASVNSNIHGGSERTIFVAFRTPATTTAAVVYKQGDQSNGISVWTNTGGVAGIDMVVDDIHLTTSNIGVDPSTWYIAEVYFDGSDTEYRAGMMLHGAGSSTPFYFDDMAMPRTTLITPTGVNSVVSLGARQGYSIRNGADLAANTLGDAFTGSTGEVVVLNTADIHVRDAVYCMLHSKWGAGTTDNTLEKDEIVPVAGAGEFEASITTAYPNPATNDVSFDVTTAATEEIRISIVSTVGLEVATLYRGMAQAGSVMPMIADVSDLPIGAYMIIVSGETTRFATPLIIQH